MNTTITVALITALAALSGAISTGYLGLLVNRGQLRTQQITSEIDRNEQHEKYLREARRDAYMAFMSQLRKVEEMFDRDLWIRSGFGKEDAISPGEIMYTATAGMVPLESHLDLILLEGPEEVSKAALELHSALNEQMMRLLTLRGTEEKPSSAVDIHKMWRRSAQDRKALKIEFIRTARLALEGKADETHRARLTVPQI